MTRRAPAAAASVGASVLSAVFGSATRASGDLVGYDAAIRQPVLHCRRIAFVQLNSGCGAATTAAYVARLLAARRTGRVLAVDASGGAASATAGPPTPPPPTPCQPDVHGLHALTLSTRGRRVTVPDWSTLVGPVTRRFDVAVTVWGVRGYPDLPAVAAASHVVCLVVPPDERAVRSAAEVASWLRDVVGTPTLIALAATGATPREFLRRPPVPAMTVRARRHRDHVRLAAALMRAASHPGSES
jgi:hypothetical protein